MIVAAGLLVAGIGSLALIARALRKAPEGYEDEHGFHIVREKSSQSGVPGIDDNEDPSVSWLTTRPAQYQRNPRLAGATRPPDRTNNRVRGGG